MSQQKATRGASGREQLEAAFEKGPVTFRHQLRLILAVSQINAAQPSSSSPRRPVYTIREARLQALSQLGRRLKESQIRQLVNEASRIPDAAVRLPVLAQYAMMLSPQNYRSLVRDIWVESPQIRDAAVRAQTLFDIAPLLTLVNDEPATPSSLLRLLSLAQNIRSTEARVRSLIALAPQLPHDMTYRTFARVLVELSESKNDLLCAKSLVALAPHIPQGLEERALTIVKPMEDPVEQARAYTALARYMPDELKDRLRHEALSAIERIEGEEERAEALIGFAPNLEFANEKAEFPAILERALTMAMIISRRHIRARVLVALAPHLTSDLQGEALAAVNSLSSDRERANLLAQLAPNLAPNMLVASLALAHTMREQDARVDALTVLARHVPEHVRSLTLNDALNSAAQLPHQYERVNALVNLADILSPELLQQAMQQALDTTFLISNENARARALNLLGPLLSGDMLVQALSSADEMQDPQQRLNGLLGLIGGLPGDQNQGLRNTLMDCAVQLPIEYKRARAYISIVPHLSDEMRMAIADRVEQLEDPTDRANVYTAVINHLPQDRRSSIVGKAWEQIQQIEEGYDKASAIAAIAPYLPHSLEREMIQLILQTISSISDNYDRASAVGLLAPLLADNENASFARLPDGYSAIEAGLLAALTVPQQAQRAALLRQGVSLWQTNEDGERSYMLWTQIARQLIQLPMADLLLCVGNLLPVIEIFAGPEGLDDVADIFGLR